MFGDSFTNQRELVCRDGHATYHPPFSPSLVPRLRRDGRWPSKQDQRYLRYLRYKFQ